MAILKQILSTLRCGEVLARSVTGDWKQPGRRPVTGSSLFALRGNRDKKEGTQAFYRNARPVPGALSRDHRHGDRQQTIRSMQSLKEDFATAGSWPALFRLRAGAIRRGPPALRKAGGAWKPLTWAEWLGRAEEAAWG